MHSRLVRFALLSLLALALAPRIPVAIAGPVHPAGQWRIQVVDSLGVVGELAKLALDRDRAHIVYFQNDSCGMKYATEGPGGWTTEFVEGPLAPQTTGYPPCPLPGSIQLDRWGRPCLSYYRAFPGWLVYARRSNGGWEKEVVDGPGISLGAYSSLALDDEGQPCISYYTGDIGTGAVKYAHRTRTGWKLEVVHPAVSTATSIGLDRRGVAHIAYTGTGLEYATHTASGWRVETVDSAFALECALAFDRSGNPHIGYTGSGGRLAHAWRGASGWRHESIVGTHDARFSSIALDECGQERISYYDEGVHHLMLAVQDGGRWTVQCVDSSGDMGRGLTLALDEQDRPRIAYFDNSHGNLRYAERFGASPGRPGRHSVDAADDESGLPGLLSGSPRVELTVAHVGVQPILEYTLASEGDASLVMYDVSGRVVAVLAAGREAAGRHRVTWSATGTPPGLYFCRLRAQGVTVRRTLLLLR